MTMMNVNENGPDHLINTKLPWDSYNNHFKIIKLLKDETTYQTFEVKCLHCASTKTRTADSRSKSNLRNHLKVRSNSLLMGIDLIMNANEHVKNFTFQV